MSAGATQSRHARIAGRRHVGKQFPSRWRVVQHLVGQRQHRVDIISGLSSAISPVQEERRISRCVAPSRPHGRSQQRSRFFSSRMLREILVPGAPGVTSLAVRLLNSKFCVTGMALPFGIARNLQQGIGCPVASPLIWAQERRAIRRLEEHDPLPFDGRVRNGAVGSCRRRPVTAIQKIIQLAVHDQPRRASVSPKWSRNDAYGPFMRSLLRKHILQHASRFAVSANGRPTMPVKDPLASKGSTRQPVLGCHRPPAYLPVHLVASQISRDIQHQTRRFIAGGC